jgi:type I restriction enzyme M protein
MPNNYNDLERRLWAAADELRANSRLKASEYSIPVLGLIFLRFADHRFADVEQELLSARPTGRRRIGKTEFHARGVLFLPEDARFSSLLKLPEGANIGQAINDAMKAIEEENEDLRGVLPKTYNQLESATLVELLKLMSSIPSDIEGDAFGKIYEYFLGNFAMSEGARGGEFYTPTSIVRLIVEIIEPFHGRILDPACGSGGMFVQSARFVQRHRENPSEELSIFGQERVAETVRLCKMNLAVHGLAGDIRQSNTYYENLHDSVGRFDFVMANPPFNVNRVDKERLKGDPRYPFGLPRVDNANYLWIQVFFSALNQSGRAGFVMANSAGDTGGSELEIRRKLIESKTVDIVIAVAPNFFYTVTVPVALWFLDNRKRSTEASERTLFIDARQTYRQIDRRYREFTSGHIDLLAAIVRLYRGEQLGNILPETRELLSELLPSSEYADVDGLCRAVDMDEIASHGWSLNPGRYVRMSRESSIDVDVMEDLRALQEQLESLVVAGDELEETISRNTIRLSEA